VGFHEVSAVRALAGTALGVGICYLFGALVAWDFNPAGWWLIWRLWCLLWALLWGFTGAIIADDLFRCGGSWRS
jgi:FtsH-binding integral membrane protein